MLVSKMVRNFAKIKPLKAIGVTTDKGMKFSSQTQNHSLEIHNPLETLVGVLAACEISTMRALTSHGKLKISKVDIKKMESSYNLQKFMKGGKENRIQQVTIEGQIQTNGTQKDIDQLCQKVQNSCPVYCMLTAAGVKINSKWKNINTN